MLDREGCPENVLAIKDSLEALEGRWKLLIILALSDGTKRFSEISKLLHDISDKMLSKELKHLETNKLVKRKELPGFPLVVEYSLTAHGRSLQRLLDELHRWGLQHRREILRN